MTDNIYELTSKNIDEAKLTPMFKQYIEIKKKYEGTILFYRLGDFYETFLEDALILSKKLEITLTARDGGAMGKIPMAGIPVKAVQNYLPKLVNLGYKVAICEQMEDPALAKGLVKREVERTISSGTLIETEYLDKNENNYLAALFINHAKNTFGLAYCDVSTGEFKLTASDCSKLRNELSRIHPVELICAHKKQEIKSFQIVAELIADAPKEIREEYNCTIIDKNCFKFENAQLLIKETFNVESLTQFGYPKYEEGLMAAGGILSYLKETQKANMSKFETIKYYSIEEFMTIDENAQKGLELLATIRDKNYKGSLLCAIDKTSTNMGARLLKNWLIRPLIDINEIKNRQAGVEELLQNPKKRSYLADLLSKVYDIERLATKITNNSVSPKDFTALSSSIANLPDLSELLSDLTSPYMEKFHYIDKKIYELKEKIDFTINEDAPMAIADGNIIKSGVSKELDKYKDLLTNGEKWIENYQEKEKEKTGIKNLKVTYNKVFGFAIEVTKSNINLVPDNYVRKQTLANAERYITQELKEHESEVYSAQNNVQNLEQRIFSEFREDSKQYVTQLRKLSSDIAALDVLLSFAITAFEQNYTKPVVDNSNDFIVIGGRHPVIEQLLPMGEYVANDIALFANSDSAEKTQFMVLTGPNMSGKSTYMRQNALIAILAQMGSYVPAREAKIGIFDKIFTRIGAVDDLSLGQSTFMVEMLETSNILNGATDKSFILLDEVGRGTSTYDGVAIAWSVSEYIATQIKARTIFATHYHELRVLEDAYPQINNFRVDVAENNGEIEFLHKIVKGATGLSYGLQVAKMAGLPSCIITKANTLLNKLTKDQAYIKTNKKQISENEDISQLSLFLK